MRHTSESPAAPASANGAKSASQGSESGADDKATRHDAQEIIVGRIKKNAREQIRVALAEYKGHRYVDLRIVVPDPDGGDRPTKSGLTLKLSAIPELAELLNRAQAEASTRELL